jgi:hypothetical protein
MTREPVPHLKLSLRYQNQALKVQNRAESPIPVFFSCWSHEILPPERQEDRTCTCVAPASVCNLYLLLSSAQHQQSQFIAETQKLQQQLTAETAAALSTSVLTIK